MKQQSHYLNDVEHADTNISSGQVPTQVETEDSHTDRVKKVRIVFPSTTLFVDTNIIRQEYSSRVITKCEAH